MISLMKSVPSMERDKRRSAMFRGKEEQKELTVFKCLLRGGCFTQGGAKVGLQFFVWKVIQ